MTTRVQVLGAVQCVSFVLLLSGWAFRFVPTHSVIGPLARILDNFAPWFLGLALVSVVVSVLLGGRRGGIVLGAVTCFAAGQLYFDHRQTAQPLDRTAQPDLRVVFLNALSTNTASGGKIIDAILGFDPDIILIVERDAVAADLGRLQPAYRFVSDCADTHCEVLVASKTAPSRFWQIALNPHWGARHAVAQFSVQGKDPFFLTTSQIAKPWLSGLAEAEVEQLIAQYNVLDGALVAFGDFNAAPWSVPMQQILTQTGMRGVAMPPVTWPATTGVFGVPIDQVLTRSGPRVVAVHGFGGALGSNHRGIVADIVLP